MVLYMYTAGLKHKGSERKSEIKGCRHEQQDDQCMRWSARAILRVMQRRYPILHTNDYSKPTWRQKGPVDNGQIGEDLQLGAGKVLSSMKSRQLCNKRHRMQAVITMEQEKYRFDIIPRLKTKKIVQCEMERKWTLLRAALRKIMARPGVTRNVILGGLRY